MMDKLFHIMGRYMNGAPLIPSHQSPVTSRQSLATSHFFLFFVSKRSSMTRLGRPLFPVKERLTS